MLRREALVRIYVSEEYSASIIRVIRIGEPRTLAETGRTGILKVQGRFSHHVAVIPEIYA
jgi:hypothetical protein